MDRKSEISSGEYISHEGTRAQTMTLVATGADLPTILDSLARGIEAENPGMLCSVLLLDQARTHLVHGAAPSLLDFYITAIDGVAIGPEVGSCGCAAYFGQRVIVEDIATDPRWVLYKELARNANLGACWSEPIIDSSGRVLGTFAIYHHERNAPTRADIEVITEAAQIASIAIERKQTEEALRESEERCRLALEAANMGSWDWNIVQNEVVWSESLLRLTGRSLHSPDRRMEAILAMVHPDDRKKAMSAILRSVRQGSPYHLEFRFIRPDGTVRWAYSRGRVLRNEEDVPVRMIGVNIDITEHKQAKSALKRSEVRFERLAAASPAIIFTAVTDPVGILRYEYLSPAFEEIYELKVADALRNAMLVNNQIHRDDRTDYDNFVQYSLDTLQPFLHEWRIVTGSGKIRWLKASCRPEQLENGDTAWHGVVLDVSDRKHDQEQLIYNGLHDALTGLPNRTLLERRLESAMQRLQRDAHARYAVLFLDLDRFKVINDSMGHLAGDELLKSVALRLPTHLSGADLVARLGGDEFVVLLEHMDSTDIALEVAENILTDLQTPFSIHGHDIFVNASIGIVLATTDYRNASDLLRDVDIAMYRAKGQGGSAYKVFDSDMHIQAVKRLTMETDIRKALEHHGFVAYYQPIVDISTGKIQGFEALARMLHPTLGIILPKEFIPVAEETGLIVPLDRWMLKTACQQLADWQMRFPGHGHLKIGINLSARDFRRQTFMEEIQSALLEAGLGGSCLNLEITESLVLENFNHTIDILCQLKASGIQVSIDDFGTGYSSLSYLHRLPVNHLKVDRSFVSQMEYGDRNYQVVSTIIALSNQLGLEAVAEGIETAQQLQWLRDLGCEQGQGFYFSEPLPASDIEERFLLSQTPVLL